MGVATSPSPHPARVKEENMTEQELREKIAKILIEPDIGYLDWNIGVFVLANWRSSLPDQILALLKEALPELAKEAGYVELVDDPHLNEEYLIRKLSQIVGETRIPYECSEEMRPFVVLKYSRDILDAGWRKVILEV